ncbi:MAG: TolC family protein [Gracilimonas sp.]|uniref:TolC family protein n=1 Tax=Gracilimonas sp. TaxID=1974203 RepID=UPI0019A53D61|nr:TolC family protein [Gracilimonas sp.]MBD3617101.1 TolC family protein [Gracilimonas sp.]
MNSSKCWILFLVILWVPFQIHAQTLSLEEVVERFKQHSLQQELAELDKLRKQGAAQQYKSYMNPEVSIFSEQLNAGTLNYDETTYQISQPIELLGQPFLRNKSANKSSEAAELSYQYDRSVLIQQVKSLYAEYWFLQHKLEVYDQALEVINQVLASAKARQTEGTESGLQVQRFTVEKSRYLRERNEVELKMMQVGKQLASMITSSEETGFEFKVEADLPVEPIMEDSETLQEYALKHRADLRAMELETEALGLKYKVEKRDRMPDLKVNFGYKNQSDGSEGFVIGGGIQLPIFNRNSGSITMAEAEYRSVETSLQLQRRTIRNQVGVGYRRVQNLYAQWQEMQQNPLSAEMLETSRSAYQEGRYSLVELLDATKAYVDGRSLQHRITADYQQALFTLDTITSGKIFSTQNTSKQ